VNLKRIEKAVREILFAVGEDPDREGLKETPLRVAKMYAEVFDGIQKDPRKVFKKEMVLLRDIPFFSMCEHHLLPFIGKAHVAYIPVKGRLSGLSKLARVVDVLARRPQVQERLTGEIADTIMSVLKPKGTLVIIEAEHLCMTMRGVRKPGSTMVSSAVRGIFETNNVTRQEALALIRS
jgi:GTP cyclohydrolase IA